MKRRNQRCALTASGQVAGSEIGHHVNARELSQQGGVVELNAVADRWLAMVGVCIEFQWAMANSLSMRTNGHNVRGGALGLFQQLGTDLAVKAG